MGAWIEIVCKRPSIDTREPSHPTMGAWIEIATRLSGTASATVAPHDGCVDWNTSFNKWLERKLESHPTMGAWIEIVSQLRLKVRQDRSRTPRWVRGLKYSIAITVNNFFFVAPHDGCVDWNISPFLFTNSIYMSHPTMGAWIEISVKHDHVNIVHSRTPRWVRGLKSIVLLNFFELLRRTPRWVRGLKYFSIIYT